VSTVKVVELSLVIVETDDSWLWWCDGRGVGASGRLSPLMETTWPSSLVPSLARCSSWKVVETLFSSPLGTTRAASSTGPLHDR